MQNVNAGHEVNCSKEATLYLHKVRKAVQTNMQNLNFHTWILKLKELPLVLQIIRRSYSVTQASSFLQQKLMQQLIHHAITSCTGKSSMSKIQCCFRLLQAVSLSQALWFMHCKKHLQILMLQQHPHTHSMLSHREMTDTRSPRTG